MPSKNALVQLETLNDKLERGFTVSGNPMDELCRILRPRGYSVLVQSNDLEILKQRQPINKLSILPPFLALRGHQKLAATKGFRFKPCACQNFCRDK
jgi:hypothetical protein